MATARKPATKTPAKRAAAPAKRAAAPAKRTARKTVRPDRIIDADATVKPSGPTVTVRPIKPTADPVTFRLVDEMPALLLLRLSKIEDPNVKDVEKLSIMHDFLRVVVHPDDRHAFEDHLLNAVPVIGVAELQEILTEMVQAVQNRP